jgi:hypothetical protein
MLTFLQRDYFPTNIMNDRRVQKGNTYAAMVIPAGSYPEQLGEAPKPQARAKLEVKTRQKYPNTDIPSPEPVFGRTHCWIQTDEFRQLLSDYPDASEVGVATDFFLDRPPVPLFVPQMPLKANCKSTQIFDGDCELFDFDGEVAPMLNVLIEKTLDQARMEVLEERELAIIKQQADEFQATRNLELIEAQRYEAAESRVLQEISRRQVQQRARKSEKVAAHKKHVCRVAAKTFLNQLREGVLSSDVKNLLVNKTENELHSKVLPWLMQKVEMFMAHDENIDANTVNMVEKGIQSQKENLGHKLVRHSKELKAAAQAIEDEKLRTQKRKEDRRVQRMIRVKE